MIMIRMLFYIGLICTPIISTIEMTRRIFFPLGSGTMLFFIIGTIIFFVLNKKICVYPEYVKKTLIVFMAIYLMSGMVNLSNMMENIWQGVYGIERYILSSGLLICYLMISLYLYNICIMDKKITNSTITTCFIASYVISSFVGLIELGAINGKEYANYILELIDGMFRGDISRQPFRVQALAHEPSMYSMYLMFILPFLLYKFEISKKKYGYFLGLNIFIVLLISTFSRTGYFGCLFEFVLYCIMSKKGNIIKSWKWVIFEISIVFVCILGVNISFDYSRLILVFDTLTSNDILQSGSNMARFGSTMAAWSMFIDYPLLGVGYDQFAFYASSYYPSWSYVNPEIINWSINSTDRGDWPPAFNYYVRVLAELGVGGFVVLLAIIFQIIRRAFCVFKKNNDPWLKTVIVVFVGQLLALFNTSDFNEMTIISGILILVFVEKNRGICSGS